MTEMNSALLDWARPGADRSVVRQKMKQLAVHCAAFKGGDTKRSLVQFITTALLFFGTCTALALGIANGYWIAYLLALPAAGLLVRLFIIQHDCGHGSYFKSRKANDRLGRAISVLTFTPYGYWRKAHSLHHATSGNLDKRGIGDIRTLTVDEYRALSKWDRFRYRLYRNPIVLLLVGAPFLFLVLQRTPYGQPLKGKGVWSSLMGLNVGIVLFYGALGMLMGFPLLLQVVLPVMIVASWVGGWMFYIQHQFECTYWDLDEEWDFHEAAVLGSTYYVLPRVFQWFSGNIGLHHIHHLCGKIPNYRLQECLDGSPELQAMNRLTFLQSIKTVRLALWDESERRLIRFSGLKQAA